MRVDINIIKKSFESEGYILHTDEFIYKNNKQKLPYTCPKGHRHEIKWADWNSKGTRCPYCAGRPIITLDIIKESMAKEGYELLSDMYINNKSDIIFKCPEGHIHTTNWAKWNSHGYRCPHCYGNAKKDINNIKSYFEEEGYKLISNNYYNCYTKIDLICPNGHNYSVSWDNWNSKNSRCPKCGINGVSKSEIDLFNFINNLISNVQQSNYDIIKPKELDIVISDKKIAIEYCGLYWHSELMGKDKNYHTNKLDLCNSNGYNLITIFSDEWNKKRDIVESRLKHVLGVNDSKVIYARKCKIEAISAREAREFCEANHLQGYTGSNIKLGALYEDELVSVMTFAKPSISKGSKNINSFTWELSRFCSSLDVRVIGIASKFLSYFKNNYEWQQIFSYADRRWSTGNLYKELGFDYIGTTKQNYWYIKGNCYDRHHRFGLRKKPDEPKNITEWELRQAEGWNRIWDCGNLKYVMYNKKF